MEKDRFDFLIGTNFYAMQASHHRAEYAGATEHRKNIRIALREMLSTPGAASYWSATQSRFLESLTAAVNGIGDEEPSAH